MASFPTITPQSGTTNVAIAVKSDKVTYAVVVKLDEQGKVKSARATSREKDIANLEDPNYLTNLEAAAAKAGKVADPETVAFKQVIAKPYAGTLDGTAEIIPDESVRLDVFNIGISSKINSKTNSNLTAIDEAGNLSWTPVEPEFDATQWAQATPDRVVQTAEEKAIKALSGLQASNPAMFAAILAQFVAASQAANAGQ